MAKFTFLVGTLCALLGVVFGAFGAHALRSRLDDYALGIYQTAVQYQFIHSLALLAVALLMLQFPGSSLLKSSAVLFVLGILVFSGSLYLLSFTGVGWLGAITPLGG
ncbi:MAG: uncharacterized membrane protein YgdD (TMEM256/DUF423 family), partial [Halieaceae bacterium]